MCLTSETCHLSELRQPLSRRRSVSCDLANVNKCKLWNFDRPFGLPGHRWWDLDVGNVSYRRKMTVRVRDNCRYRQSWSMSPPSPVRNFAENPQFCTFFSSSILHNSISHFTFCFIPTPNIKRDSNEESEVDTCSPRRKAIWDGPCRIPYDKKGQCILFVCFSCVLCL